MHPWRRARAASINRLYETLADERSLEQIASARRIARGVEGSPNIPV